MGQTSGRTRPVHVQSGRAIAVQVGSNSRPAGANVSKHRPQTLPAAFCIAASQPLVLLCVFDLPRTEGRKEGMIVKLYHFLLISLVTHGHGAEFPLASVMF